ncbi:MAG: polymer-forming cytoskeletal protein [Hyphomicrobiaceae bacterium]
MFTRTPDAANPNAQATAMRPTPPPQPMPPMPPRPMNADDRHDAPIPHSKDAQPQSYRAGRTSTRDDGFSVIGSDLVMLGDNLTIVSRGGVQIDGQIRGDIYAAEIIINTGGRVEGCVSASRVVVRGGIEGLVRGEDVILQSTANVNGDVHHASLVLEEGAVFEGRSRRPAAGESLKPDLEAAVATRSAPSART